MDFESLASARVVDLSVTLSEWLPGTWPEHMNYAHHNWNWFTEVEGPTGRTRSADPYQTNFIVIDEHCGTHFDAPTHFVPPQTTTSRSPVLWVTRPGIRCRLGSSWDRRPWWT